jgi:hypothetical protein
MTNLNNEIGLCHHCQEPIWENDSYVQRGSLDTDEIEQYHVSCFREVEPKRKDHDKQVDLHKETAT